VTTQGRARSGVPTVKLHKAEAGETLQDICLKYGITGADEIERVARDNSLQDPAGVRPGMVLRIIKWPQE
jgi:hypothetical protein